MNRLKRAVLWAVLVFIILLIALSICGAFLGADRAKDFFNSLPLAVYWIALTGLLLLGLVVFPRLLHNPALLLIHAGCILVLAGGIWGSRAGHSVQRQVFGIDKIPQGLMPIFAPSHENRVYTNQDTFRELPFLLRLRKFRIEYYRPGALLVRDSDGRTWKLPAEVGAEADLGDEVGSVKIIQVFENFKIDIEGDKPIAYDAPRPGSNPALEVQRTLSSGEVETRYVFRRFGGHQYLGDTFVMGYKLVVRDFISELDVVEEGEEGEVVASKKVEVNHPLHYGGYYFYQHSYDDVAGLYTVLMVASDSGVGVVYAGYWLLCLGVLWHFWLRRIRQQPAQGM